MEFIKYGFYYHVNEGFLKMVNLIIIIYYKMKESILLDKSLKSVILFYPA